MLKGLGNSRSRSRGGRCTTGGTLTLLYCHVIHPNVLRLVGAEGVGLAAVEVVKLQAVNAMRPRVVISDARGVLDELTIQPDLLLTVRLACTAHVRWAANLEASLRS